MVSSPPVQQSNADTEHLKLLSIFHYVVGGMAVLFACFPIIHLVIGLFLAAPLSWGMWGRWPAFVMFPQVNDVPAVRWTTVGRWGQHRVSHTHGRVATKLLKT